LLGAVAVLLAAAVAVARVCDVCGARRRKNLDLGIIWMIMAVTVLPLVETRGRCSTRRAGHDGT